MIACRGAVFGREAAEGQLVWQIQDLIGRSGAETVQTLIRGAHRPGVGSVAAVVGLLMLFYGATSVVSELRAALNTIWCVPLREETGLKSLISVLVDRTLSFAMVLAIGFLLLVSLAINAALSALGDHFHFLFNVPEWVLQAVDLIVSYTVIIDEAHRSVFQKYRAIFDYFDSLLVGLTATPKDEVDRNTYGLFDLEDGVPTDAYSLEEAVRDGFLVPPKAVSVPLKFQREGIKYDDLSEDDKDQWDALEWDEDGGVPDRVDAGGVNSGWLTGHGEQCWALMTAADGAVGTDRRRPAAEPPSDYTKLM